MSAAEKLDLHISPGAWFRQELLFHTFGISTEAARKYRSGGLWLEGKHWRWDPAGRIVYNKKAIEAWMEGKP
ncbi:DNA-binding protein [Metapseudomonas sp. CR1201]